MQNRPAQSDAEAVGATGVHSLRVRSITTYPWSFATVGCWRFQSGWTASTCATAYDGRVVKTLKLTPSACRCGSSSVPAVIQPSTGSGSSQTNSTRGAFGSGSRCNAESRAVSRSRPPGVVRTSSWTRDASSGPGSQSSSPSGSQWVVGAGSVVQNGAPKSCAGRTAPYASGSVVTTAWVSWLPSRAPFASRPRYTPAPVA